MRPSLGYRLVDPTDSVRRSSGRRIGILGGSFNPPHAGHLHISELALQRLDLDEIWWLLTPQNPLKSTAESTAFDARFDACVEMLANHPDIRVTALEAALDSNLTVKSLAEIIRLFPNHQFTWVMGADNLAGFHRWFGWRKIAEMLPIAVIDRPGYGIAALASVTAQKLRGTRRYTRHYNSGWQFVAGPQNPLSSTALRRQRTR